MQSTKSTLVRSDAPWTELTEQEQGIIRLWLAIGLEVEWRCADPDCTCDKEWHDFPPNNAAGSIPTTNYRLKP